METTTADAAATVTLELEGPRPQRRATIAFRLLLAIPHIVWAWLLSIAVAFAVIAAWVGALVVGRMPEGLGTFIGRVLQYFGRVGAYLVMLTDRYPSFALDEADYPVSVLVPQGGRLNRAAVFFRFILLIPAAIAVTVLWGGVAVCLVFIWLIVLVAGRMPPSLFEALAAAHRYALRFYAFAYMLTSEYPRGLFGDRGLAADARPASASAPAFDAPSEGGMPTAYPHEAHIGLRPRITKLVLSKAAKRIVVLFLVLGVGVNAANVAAAITRVNAAGRAHAELSDAYGDIYDASVAYSSAVQTCAAQQGGLPCLRDAALRLQSAFTGFRAKLAAIKVPAPALGQVHDVDQKAAAVVDSLTALAGAGDAAQYGARAGELQQRLEAFDAGVTALDRMLVVSG